MALGQAVTQAGFEFDTIEIEAIGQVAPAATPQGLLRLELPGRPDSLLIAPNPNQAGQQPFHDLSRRVATGAVSAWVTGRAEINDDAGAHKAGRTVMRLGAFRLLEAKGH